jgi:hypothetical protein
MMSAERSLSANALNSLAWPRRFEEERAIKLAWAGGHANDRFNNVGRRPW